MASITTRAQSQQTGRLQEIIAQGIRMGVAPEEASRRDMTWTHWPKVRRRGSGGLGAANIYCLCLEMMRKNAPVGRDVIASRAFEDFARDPEGMIKEQGKILPTRPAERLKAAAATNPRDRVITVQHRHLGVLNAC